MLPETWLPTVTFTTGFNVPVAVTTCVKSPRVDRRGLIFRRVAVAALEIPDAAGNHRDDRQNNDRPLDPTAALFSAINFNSFAVHS